MSPLYVKLPIFQILLKFTHVNTINQIQNCRLLQMSYWGKNVFNLPVLHFSFTLID